MIVSNLPPTHRWCRDGCTPLRTFSSYCLYGCRICSTASPEGRSEKSSERLRERDSAVRGSLTRMCILSYKERGEKAWERGGRREREGAERRKRGERGRERERGGIGMGRNERGEEI
jgi:hypothetical protein